MSDLPESWEELRLGEVAARTASVYPSKAPIEAFELYSVPSFSQRQPEIVRGAEIKSSKQAVQPEDVLLCKIVPHINRVWVVGKKSEQRQIASGEWIVYRDHCCDPDYLRYCLSDQSFRDRFMQTVSGVGGSLMRARPSEVAEIAIPLAPLPEQRRIVATMDSLTGKSRRARNHLDHIPRLVEKYKQAVLAAAFRGRFPHVSADHARPLSLVVSLRTGPFGSALHKSDYVSNGVPIVNPMHIVGGCISTNPDTSISEEKASSLAEFRLQEGDVVLARRGVMGRCAVVTPQEAGFVCGTGSMIVRPGQSITPHYLQRYLSSPDVVAALEEDAVGTTMVNLNQSILLRQQIPVPSVEDQRQAVRRIDTAFAWIDRLASEATSARRLIDRLDQSVLAKAFRGELVPQDPDDEPANVLLDRIRAERGAAPKPKRERRAKVA